MLLLLYPLNASYDKYEQMLPKKILAQIIQSEPVLEQTDFATHSLIFSLKKNTLWIYKDYRKQMQVVFKTIAKLGSLSNVASLSEEIKCN